MKRGNHRDIRISLSGQTSRRQIVPPGRQRQQPQKQSEAPASSDEDITSAAEAYRLQKAYEWEYRYAERRVSGRDSDYRSWGRYAGGQAWAELADKLRSQGIEDPVRYVRALFSRLPLLPTDGKLLVCIGEPKPNEEFRPMSPQRLTESAMVETYRGAERDSNQRFRSELSTASSKILLEQIDSRERDKQERMYDATWSVLLDDHLSLSPLFRFVLASSMIREPADSPAQREWNGRFLRVCNRYRDAAYIQFLGSSETYSKLYGQRLPHSFAREAEAFYEALLLEDRPQEDE